MDRPLQHFRSLPGRWLRLAVCAVLCALFASALAAASPFLYVANSGNGTVIVIDAATNTVIKTISTGINSPVAVAITPDHSRVYVATTDPSTIYVIATATNTVTSSFPLTPPGYTYPFHANSMVFSPDGTRLYVTTGNDSGSGWAVVPINTQNNSVLSPYSGFDNPTGIDITPNGEYLYVVNSISQSLSVVTASTGTITQNINGFSVPVDVAIDANGTYAYVANDPNGGGAVALLDLSTNVVTKTIYGFSGASGTALAPNGEVAYELSDQVAGVAEFSTVTDTLGPLIGIAGLANAMVITPDSTKGYITVSGNGTGSIQVISVSSNKITATITSGVDVPRGIALNP